MIAGIDIVFWIISTVVLISAFMVVTLKNIFHCALFLILCLFAVAGIYILLDAEFLAAAQVLIYVGAIAILMIFAIMLSENISSRTIKQSNDNVVIGFFICMTFVLGASILIKFTIEKLPEVFLRTRGLLPPDNIMMLGKYLMTDFMLPFEVVSILLLAAMIGAIVLARKEKS